MTRSPLYVLLPLSLVGALVLASQGVPQNFKPYESVPLLQPTVQVDATTKAETPVTEQTLPLGPAASQIMHPKRRSNHCA